MQQTLNCSARNVPVVNAVMLTALAYVPAVFCIMTIGVIVPFLGILSSELHASPARLGLGIALFSVPSAILAVAGGSLIDRYGVRRPMLFSTVVAALGSLFIGAASSLQSFDMAMLIAGLGFAGICIASPCLIMLMLTDGARTRAISFASTFAPTGYAAGLLLAGVFTGTNNWRFAVFVHGGLLLAAFILLLVYLPRIEAGCAHTGESLRQSVARILSICREPRALRLGLAVALPNAVSYGTSLAAPSYLARVHHMSIGTSSAGVATAKLAAVILGGLCMGQLLVRTARPWLLFASMVIIGLIAQLVLFLPVGGFGAASAALVVWLFAFGGMAGGAMTLLPAVARDPSHNGAASGLVNQFISLASFAAPSTWLVLQDGLQFIVLAAACLLVALIALPAR